MDWLKTLAPTLASCLGGPLAGIGVSLLEKVLGISADKVMDVVQSGKLTADQVAQIKVAELELKKMEEEQGFKFEQLAVEDRKSARDMQTTTKSIIPAVLSIVITGGFFGVLGAIMYYPAAANNQPLLIMLGSLGGGFIQVLNFWFGSTNGSQKKDVMLANSTPIK